MKEGSKAMQIQNEPKYFAITLAGFAEKSLTNQIDFVRSDPKYLDCPFSSQNPQGETVQPKVRHWICSFV